MKDNKDREEVLAAVKQSGNALQSADESLQKGQGNRHGGGQAER